MSRNHPLAERLCAAAEDQNPSQLPTGLNCPSNIMIACREPVRQCLRVKGGRSLGDDTLVLGAVGVVEGTVVEMGVVEAAEGEAKQRLLDEAREVPPALP